MLYSSGLLHHPCVSSVIYLSGATVAGPTVVLACMLIALPTCMQDDCPTDEPLMSRHKISPSRSSSSDMAT